MAVGAALGWAAGVAPGPITLLVITAGLQRGLAAAVRMALVPLLSDAPVVGLSLAVLAALPHAAVTVLGLGGGVYLLWLGVQTFREAGHPPELQPTAAREMARGVVVNWLNPHPWVFWIGVGGPILIRAWEAAPSRAVGFVASFYLLLVGAKLVLAVLSAGGRRLLRRDWYRRAVEVGGLAILATGVWAIVSLVAQGFSR